MSNLDQRVAAAQGLLGLAAEGPLQLSTPVAAGRCNAVVGAVVGAAVLLVAVEPADVEPVQAGDMEVRTV